MRIFSIVLLLCSCAAFGAPVTYEVTPTFAAPSSGGAVTGFRLYQGCDQAAQTCSTLIRGCGSTESAACAVVSGSAYSFAGDTNSPPTIGTRAWNATGEGGFNAFALTTPPALPGQTITTYICTVPTPAATYSCVPVLAP